MQNIVGLSPHFCISILYIAITLLFSSYMPAIVTCQRYVCQNAIPLTMTVLIYHCTINNLLYQLICQNKAFVIVIVIVISIT